ncbi:MAG: ribbon-helix-helix protein, CopG family [Cyanobacteriota bacterium]|nr:ribbon-helix-helix protein, CopG family [Cyanobacteriota bacterium]
MSWRWRGLEVRLSDQVNQRLEALAAAEGLTKADVFRRALALYMLAKKQEEARARLQFAHGDQVETLVNI